MITASSVIDKLKTVADYTPEFEGENIFPEIQQSYTELLEKYPKLNDYPDYLEFLRQTGGAYIDHKDFSLGIYGFGGYVVTSFDEGSFLDQERYFLFGEVLFKAEPEINYFLAFDFQSPGELILMKPDELSQYRPCCHGFLQLLEDFANGRYPVTTAQR